MTGETSKTVVNSWNEWETLKLVIAGTAEGAMLQAPEPAVYRDFAKDGFPIRLRVFKINSRKRNQ